MGIKELINSKEREQGPISHKLHGLLELSIAVTGRGEINDDYIESIHFPIGNLWISSDPYYGRIDIYFDDEEIEMIDEETIMKLAKELKKRLLTFDRKIKKTREELVKEIFDKPLDNIIQKD